MRVRLIRKLAEHLDGVDLTGCREGDALDLSHYEAQLLIAERWAIPWQEQPRSEIRGTFGAARHVVVAHAAARRTVDQLRRTREQLERRRFDHQEARRAEDRIREQLHDARAATIDATGWSPKQR